MSTTPDQEPSAPNQAPHAERSVGTPTESAPTAPTAAYTQPTVPLPEQGAYPAAPHAGHVPAEEQHQAAQPQNPQFGTAQPQDAHQHGDQTAQPQFAAGQAFAHEQQGQAEPLHGHDTATAQPKSRTGALLAGLAIGALLGGVVGGGVSAIVASNVAQPNSTAQGGGTLTLSNSRSATAISGVAAVATPSVVTLEVAGSSASGSGSGVIYREDGYIITNAHVVTLDGAAGTDAAIRVKLSDGRILDGETVGVDPYADLAVVKVDAENLPAVKVADSSELNVGDVTVAIGAPMNLANTVTSGVISSVDRGISVGSPLIPQDPSQGQGQDQDQGDGGGGFPWDFRFGTPEQDQGQQQSSGGTVTLPVIQTDASINPGNSGGALLNDQGELIGINVAIASPTSSNGTAGSDGLGFAIPSNLASRVADALIKGEQPSHGLLGASVGDSSQDTDEDANHAGGLLIEVNPGGAAEKAGLRAGDVITAVNGIPAADGTSVSALIRMNEGGSDVKIDYTRGGKAAETTATLDRLEW
ncbi:S1C family serine protease [Leucobacter ruminantium]|uniref:Trypsin-like peptidase domain-containing protein n=1 Tax=Leucobacter ruminantium TaxID=1289170 RepID=A0A939LWQ9_9MICO|nr:trypsin-like peptidase domain-containing protein [Leucobacter ruminantium]MBO1806125.1 trypsin-like peptidase domain-containing protein [Leucobacter ruminantium]